MVLREVVLLIYLKQKALHLKPTYVQLQALYKGYNI